ncbi:glycoside hydrolase family 28 protein [Chondrinema litorale]|uniref:glycoside hydrolase family 28 protein n=1 Tax=Chondrinema litorale TaxID=2994555 RepID=UPI002543AC51|nr:glycoside hydrolase family 28 protein [Chondrinema litorale]UZR97628.1 glycoside hydrolase family 28 protein [Chondrinema litorale]
MNRSTFNIFCCIICLGVFACNKANYPKEEEPDNWKQLEAILDEIKVPEFPDKTYLVTDFGAVADGTIDCTEAINTAITKCSEEGGGKVVVPAGKYFSGAIHLKSNVNLHLEKDATILFSTDPKAYMPVVYTRWEGVELMNYSSLVYAYEAENIAVTGEGTLDGQATADNWWKWKGRKDYGYVEGEPSQLSAGNKDKLMALGKEGVPVEDRVFGDGFYLRPQFVQPYKCKNVLIEGIKIQNSPMWVLNPVLCTNVTIKGVTVESQGPNSDGCDPESCKNVLIKNCFFNTGDDCIAIKSGRNEDGRRVNVASENIIIQNCQMANGHGGVVIGSEASGGVKNVFAENCKMDSPELDRVLRIKTSSKRGGVIENIFMRNVEVGQVKEQVVRVNMFYEDPGEYMPTVRNIEVKNLTVKHGGKIGVLAEAYKESPIENIRLVDCTIDDVKVPYKLSNVEGLKFENVKINGETLPEVVE